MRMLLKWEIGLEAGNDAIRSGKIAELNQLLMALIRPEATYFGTEGGKRVSYIFFDLEDPAQIRCSTSRCSSNSMRRSNSFPS